MAKWIVEAKAADLFFEEAVEQQDSAQGLSLREEKQMSRVKRGALEAPAMLELSVEAQRVVGLLMVEAQTEMGSSENLGAVKVIPVPLKKHLPSILLLEIPFQSRCSFHTPNKGQEFYSTNISLFS